MQSEVENIIREIDDTKAIEFKALISILRGIEEQSELKEVARQTLNRHLITKTHEILSAKQVSRYADGLEERIREYLVNHPSSLCVDIPHEHRYECELKATMSFYSNLIGVIDDI